MKTWKPWIVALALWILWIFVYALAQAFDKNDPKFKSWFEKAKVGDTYGYSVPAGDGCNTCAGQVRKISETEVRDSGTVSCTLRGCNFDTIIKVTP